MSVDYRPNYDPADVDSDYGHTGGDITVPTFTANMKPFRFWCQKALPLVYDDSLSYYEVLCKVVKQMNDFLTDLQTATGAIDQFAQQFVINQQFLNEMADQLGQNIEDLETYINERMTDFMTAYTQLQDYVNNYFDNLDVQQEINNKLDEMASDGTFNDLFDPVVTAWMTAKTAQIDAAIAGQDAIQAQQNGRISVLEGRMDTFSSLPSGSTSGNAELLDIRTNFLGEVYPTAGEAVRASDMIASGFQSISATKLEEWDGNDNSSVYDTIQIDISGYKGGHVVVIGSFKYFQSDLTTTGTCSVYATNTPGKVEDANAVNYLPGITNSIFKDFTQLTTSISGEERLLLQFAIPDDYAYQYLKIGHFEHNAITGSYTEPLYIVYANSWSRTPVDDTLTIAGDAADAKAAGDALDELNERLTQLNKAYIVNLFDPSDNTYVENAYIDGNGNVVEANAYFISNHIPVNPGDTFVATYASATGTTSVRVYNKAGNRIGNVTGTLSDDSKYITFTIPSDMVNAAYMTVNGRTTLTEFMIIEGSVYPSFYIQKYALDEDVRLKANEDFLELDENINSMNTVLGYVPAGTKSVTTSNAVTGYFVNATNNSVNASSNFNITNSIQLYRGQTISIIAQGYLTAVAILSKYYSADDVYETVVASTDSTLKTYTWTADEDCYVRCSYNKTATPVVTVTTPEDFLSVIRNIEDAITSGGESKIEYPQLFDNVLCIGDSLTVGYDGSGDTPLVKNYPHFIEKLMVCDTGMKAHGGWTAKKVWDDDISTAIDLDSYDCAIIFLGTNGGLTDTVDTDCKQDYTQNTDNNTGCYGKIIGKIKADAPNCRIFCVAGVNDYIRRATTMNPAVRALASFYNVGLIDIENCIMSDNGASGSMERYLYRPVDGIHYNALGYMTMANMFYDSMREFMSNHRSMYDDYNSN